MSINSFKKAASNKVVWYMVTRYIVYFITFISSLIMAARLGPYYMGIWGAVILILRYFHYIDFGIGNSITVLLVKNKENKESCARYEKAALVILGLLSGLVMLVATYHYFVGIGFIQKYELENLFYVVCIIAILQYFNDYCLRLSRVKGKMFEFTFYQSVIQVLVLISVFFAQEEQLLYVLVGVYLVSHVLSAIIYLKGGSIQASSNFETSKAKEIIRKGFFLWIYNFCFYMIILSTKTIIGANYSVQEFGFFTFAYSIAHAAMLLLTAFSFLITPKLLDKFNTNDKEKIESTVKLIRVNYVYLSYALMYLAMMFFPVLLYLLPKYQSTLLAINLTSLATLLYANSFGYISFLMAHNKEKTIARNSVACMLVNIALALVLVKVFHTGYEYVILATLFAYLLYALLTVQCGKKAMEISCSPINLLFEVFPLRLLLTFIGSMVVTIINDGRLMFIPFVLFVLLNTKELKEIYFSFKKILFHPNVIDINK